MSDSAAPQICAVPPSNCMFAKAFIPGLILGLVVGGLGGAFIGGLEKVPEMPKSIPPAPSTNPAAGLRDGHDGRDGREVKPAEVTPPKPGDVVDPKKPATTPAATTPPATTPGAPK